MFPTNYVPNDDSLFHEYVCVINVKIHTHTLVYINQIKYIYIKRAHRFANLTYSIKS